MNRPQIESLMLVDATTTAMETGTNETMCVDLDPMQRPIGLDSSSIASLTRMGVMSYQTQNFERALEYFLSALHHVEGKLADTSCSPSLLYKSLASSQGATGLKRLRSTTTTTRETAVSCSKDCDEGLHEFNDVVMFSEEADIQEVSMTLYFDVAQTLLAMKIFEEAYKWFQRALEQLSATMGSDAIAEYKILHNLGYCSYQLNYESAIDYFHAACRTLSTLDMSDNILATQTYNCIGVLFFNLADPDTDSALKVFRKCLEIYNANPTCYTPTQLATLLNNFGRVYYLKGELEKATQFYQQSLTLRRQEFGEASIDVAATVYNLGNTYHKLKDFSRATECYDEFLMIAETHLGLQTREVAFVYKCKAEILQEMKEPESALQLYDKALQLSKTALGGDPREIGCILNKAGNLCFEQGRYQEALKYYVWGLEIENSCADSDDSSILVTLTNIAQTHKHLGRMEMALSFYCEVYNIQVRTPGTSKLDIASTLSSIGLMLYHLKHYEDAFDTYQEALQVRRDYHGSDEHADIASTLNAIGLVLFKQCLYELCMRYFHECLEIRRKLFGADHGDVAMVWYNLASVSFETGDDETALERYEEALRVERVSLGDDHPDIILTMVHLGQVKQQCGLLDEALATFEEALRIHKSQPEKDRMQEARIYNFIGNCLLQKGDIPNMMFAFAAASRMLMSTRCDGEPLAIKGYNLYGLSKLHPECAPAA
jgi:tetratricopeptide (TPR) repeat protein